jgi:hypothetical protein
MFFGGGTEGDRGLLTIKHVLFTKPFIVPHTQTGSFVWPNNWVNMSFELVMSGVCRQQFN